MGVNKAERPDGPSEWTPVLNADEVTARVAKRVEFNGTSILLYKRGHKIYAIGAVCAHEGGPLEEGEFFEKEPEGLCVECPWHQSVYAMQDGRVVHGPSTYEVPAYEARVREGQVEVRLIERKPVEQEDSRQMVGELMAE